MTAKAREMLEAWVNGAGDRSIAATYTRSGLWTVQLKRAGSVLSSAQHRDYHGAMKELSEQPEIMDYTPRSRRNARRRSSRKRTSRRSR